MQHLNFDNPLHPLIHLVGLSIQSIRLSVHRSDHLVETPLDAGHPLAKLIRDFTRLLEARINVFTKPMKFTIEARHSLVKTVKATE